MATPVTILDHIEVATSAKQIQHLLNVGNHTNRGVQGGGQIRRSWLKAARKRYAELGIVFKHPRDIIATAKRKEQRRKHLRNLLRSLRGQSTE